MPKVRLLANWTNDKGEPQAAGAIVDVTGEQADDLHNRGQASLINEEEQQAKAQQESGQYSARATREGTAPLSGGTQEPPTEDQPKKK